MRYYSKLGNSKLQELSMTPQAILDLQANQHIINHWFSIEDILGNEECRYKLFELLAV